MLLLFGAYHYSVEGSIFTQYLFMLKTKKSWKLFYGFFMNWVGIKNVMVADPLGDGRYETNIVF